MEDMTTLDEQTTVSTPTPTQIADVFATVKAGQHVLVDVLGISTPAGRTAANLGLHAFDRDSLALLVIDPLTGDFTVPTQKQVIPLLGRFTVMNGHVSFTAEKNALNTESEGGATGCTEAVTELNLSVQFQAQLNSIGQPQDAAPEWVTGTVTVRVTA